MVRKHLSADALIKKIHLEFEQLEDQRSDSKISLSDALMSGFAVFALKDPSLLAFEQRRNDRNLQTIYHISRVPSDTQMRTILDDVEPEDLRPAFQTVFRELQRGKVLEGLVYFQDCYLLTLDGSEYFSSHTIHCNSCLEKKAKSGQLTYSHQMLMAALVHPDRCEVIPLMPEPIIKQDGDNKNDCERHAAKRFLKKFRQTHPHLSVIVTEDGLSSNGPHIQELILHDMHYILGAKAGDHAFLFAHMETAFREGRAVTLTWEDPHTGTIHHFRYLQQVPLNESHPDLLVNFLEYWEMSADGVKYFSWVTDLPLSADTVWYIMRAGRARWKIENETLNTLKNQGYHFEHNFGHGEKHLSVVFALLMMLAFLVDQTQQLSCALFQAVWQKCGSKRELWDRLRSAFRDFLFDSMQQLYEALWQGILKQKPILVFDTS